MKIVYKGNRPRDVIPVTKAAEFHVEPGEVVDVDDATAKSLLDQVDLWAKPEPKNVKTDKDGD